MQVPIVTRREKKVLLETSESRLDSPTQDQLPRFRNYSTRNMEGTRQSPGTVAKGGGLKSELLSQDPRKQEFLLLHLYLPFKSTAPAGHGHT